MYRHILIPTDGSELAELGVAHGLSLAKLVGAKVTVVIAEEQVVSWSGAAEAFLRWEVCNPMKPSLQRPRTGAAISSSWHRTDAADYPQLCLAV